MQRSCFLFFFCLFSFFFQAEDGIRDLVRSRGLGDVYKRQVKLLSMEHKIIIQSLENNIAVFNSILSGASEKLQVWRAAPEKWNLLEIVCHLYDEECDCLLYTSDAADERSSVDLGGRRIIKKKNQKRK